MKHFIIACLVLLAGLSGFAQKTRKTVFVIADGIPFDMIHLDALDNFRKISSQGGFNRALVGGEKGTYNETPTISAVGYNSVLTGTWVNKHNVWDNDIAAPNYSYPTIFRLCKEQYPQKKTAVFSSWLENRTRLVGDALAATGSFPVDFKLDGLERDTLQYPHDKQRDFMHRIDERVSKEAERIIREQAPDLSWVYLEYTDDMAHMHGNSPEFEQAIRYTDEQVGRIWNAIQYREQQFNEEWLLIVTTDHGRDSVTGHNHGGQSAREKSGWILTNAKDLNDRFKKGNAEIVDIMPSIARFMNIQLPEAIAREVDGVPFTGKLSLVGPSVSINGKEAVLTWKPVQKKGKVKIWGSATNNFKKGSPDDYRLLKTTKLKKGRAVIQLADDYQGYYKFTIEGKYNAVNRWLAPLAKPD